MEFGDDIAEDYYTVCRAAGGGAFDVVTFCNMAADDFTRKVTDDPYEYGEFLQGCIEG